MSNEHDTGVPATNRSSFHVPLLSLRVQAIVDGERVAEGAYAMAMDDLRQSNYIDLAERAVALLGRQIGELLRATTPAELEFRVGEARRAREAKVDELAALRSRVADAEHARAVAVATLSEQLDAANARVATLEAECPPGHVKMPHGDVVRVLGRFWETQDGVIVARPDCMVYVCEGLDRYTRWSGKVVPMLFQNWLNKTDSEWAGNPSVGAKSRCPDGGWHCWSTREAAEAAIAARAATGQIGGGA